MDKITSYKLGELILNAIERWETRIIVDNVEVVARPDQNQYKVNLEYRLINDSRDNSIITFTNILRAL